MNDAIKKNLKWAYVNGARIGLWIVVLAIGWVFWTFATSVDYSSAMVNSTVNDTFIQQRLVPTPEAFATVSELASAQTSILQWMVVLVIAFLGMLMVAILVILDRFLIADARTEELMEEFTTKLAEKGLLHKHEEPKNEK